LERATQLAENARLVRLVRVKLETEGPQAVLFEPPLHDIERGHLLGDEKNRLLLRQTLRDHVRDRLRFPGARRPFENKALALRREIDCRKLRRIRIPRAERRFWAPIIVQPLERRRRERGIERLVGTMHEMVHYGALTELVLARVEVLPHQVLREREEADPSLLGDLPPRHVLDGLTNDSEHRSHVNPGFVLRQWIEARDLDLKIRR